MGLALALSVPSITADAAGKKSTSKKCTAADSAGKKVSFTCSATEKCCWDAFAQKGQCVPATGMCL
jgi:hypothetical protein